MKRLLLFLSLLLLATFAWASGGKESVAGGTQKVITLSMAHFWGPSDPKYKPFTDLVQKFMQENPSIKIKLNTYPTDDEYIPALNADFAANKIPDIFFTWPGFMAKHYYDSGEILELTPYLNKDPKWKSNFAPGTLNVVQYGGKQLSIPIEAFIVPVFYNKAIFAKYNLSVPKTFDQLLQVITKLNANGVIPLAASIDKGWTLGLYWTVFSNRTMGVENVREAFNKGDFSDQGWLEAAKLLVKFRDAHAFPKDFVTLQNDEALALFMNSKAAMYQHGTWHVGSFVGKNAPAGFPEKVGFFNFPSVSNGKGSAQDWLEGIITTISISKKLQDNPTRLDAALKFLKYLTSPESAKYLSEQSKSVIPVKTKLNEQKMGTLMTNLIQASAKAKNTYTLYTLSSPPEMQQVIQDQLTAMWLGQKSAEDAIGVIRSKSAAAYGNK